MPIRELRRLATHKVWSRSYLRCAEVGQDMHVPDIGGGGDVALAAGWYRPIATAALRPDGRKRRR